MKMVDRQISFNSYSNHVGALRMVIMLSTAMICSTMMIRSCHGFSINGGSISNQPRTTSTTTRRISSSVLVPWISDQERHHQKLSTTNTKTTIVKSSPSDSSDDNNSGVNVDMSELQAKKTELISACQRKPSKMEINALCNSLEKLGEQLGVGQGSSYSGLMGGEWELLYSPEDVTRSSPFFWAFRQAFPDQSDDIFSITDSIPAPIKEVGPATQTIELTGGGGGASLGTLVSRVKVATLGGLATSIMTTRTTIVGVEGLEGLRLKIETTKPEDSTILKSLGPFGETINANSPPFPSGEALEKVKPGSSEVVMKTTYCDETLRISRNASSQNIQDAYVWRRTSFGSSYKV